MIRIKNWESIYEDHRTRELKREMNWVPFKISFSGYGYAYLMDEFKDKGVAYFGTFMLLVELAAKSPNRGTILRSNGTPYEPKGIARVLRLSVEMVQETIAACSSEDCDWLEIIPNVDNLCKTDEKIPIPRDPAESRDASRRVDLPQNQEVTENEILTKKDHPARSRGPARNAGATTTEQNNNNNNNTTQEGGVGETTKAVRPTDPVLCNSLRDKGEEKEIQNLLKTHFSKKRMQGLKKLVPGITASYIREKLEIMKSSNASKPAAFLWAALTDDYKPKTISSPPKKNLANGITKDAYANLSEIDKEKYEADEALNGEVLYYLVSVHPR